MEKTKILSMKNDYVFKRILSYRGKEKRIGSFVTAVTGIEVEKVHVYHDVAVEKDFSGQKLGIMDIVALVNDDTIVNIEMQNYNTGDIKSRAMYYADMLGTMNLKAGEDYDELPNIISIVVLNYDTPEFDKYKKETILVDSETLEILKAAYEELEQMSKDEQEKLHAFSREKEVRDAIALKNKGLKEGEEKGKIEGLKEGLKKGEKKGKIEFAKKLLAKGLLSIDEIAENADLSKEEVRNLAKVS